jgi:hypothetical protein
MFCRMNCRLFFLAVEFGQQRPKEACVPHQDHFGEGFFGPVLDDDEYDVLADGVVVGSEQPPRR